MQLVVNPYYLPTIEDIKTCRQGRFFYSNWVACLKVGDLGAARPLFALLECLIV